MLQPGGLGPRSRYALLSLIGQGVVYLALFLTSLIIARKLGPDGKGEYTAWTLATLFASLALAGTVSTGLGRAYLAGERATLGPAAIRHGVLALAGSALLAAPAVLAGLDPFAAVCFIVIAAPANVIVLDLLVVFQASKRPLGYQAVRVARTGTLLVGLCVLLLVGVEDIQTGAYVLWGASMLTAAVLALWLITRSLGRRSGGSLRDFARLGRGGLATNMSDWALLRLDVFIVLPIAGVYQLGLYSVAVNFAEVAMMAGQSVGLGVFEDQRTLRGAALRRLIVRTAWFGAIVTAAVVAAGLVLIEPLFGSEFADSRLPLLLLGPGIAARAVSFAGQQILLARGEGRVLGRLMVLVLTFAAIAATVGTLLAGIEGAAAGASLSYLLHAAITLVLLRREAVLDGPGA